MEVKLNLLILFIAIIARFIHSFNEISCDFSEGEGTLSDSHVSICLRKMNPYTKIHIICPKEVKGEIDKSKRLDDAFQIKIIDIEGNYDEYADRIQEEEQRRYVQHLAEVVELGGGNVVVQEPEEEGQRQNNENKKEEEDKRKRKKVEEEVQEYSIYPNNADETISTIFVDDLIRKTSIRNFGVFDVFGTRGEKVVSKIVLKDKEIVTLKPPQDGYLTVKNHYVLVYICSQPQYLIKCDSNFLRLALNSSYFDINNYLKLRLPILDDENVNIRVGVALIYLSDLRILQTGCGNVPTKFFTNAAEYDSVNKLVHCEVDVMTNPNVGFYCEGTIEPYNCFRFFKNYNYPNKMIYMRDNTHYLETITGFQLSYANYKRENIYKSFKGYCECINEEDKVVARIVVQRKFDHVCNIASLLMKDRAKKIPDEWFNVTLHPGDTLKIILPINADNIILDNMKMERRIEMTDRLRRKLRRLRNEDILEERERLSVIDGDISNNNNTEEEEDNTTSSNGDHNNSNNSDEDNDTSSSLEEVDKDTSSSNNNSDEDNDSSSNSNTNEDSDREDSTDGDSNDEDREEMEFDRGGLYVDRVGMNEDYMNNIGLDEVYGMNGPNNYDFGYNENQPEFYFEDEINGDGNGQVNVGYQEQQQGENVVVEQGVQEEQQVGGEEENENDIYSDIDSSSNSNTNEDSDREDSTDGDSNDEDTGEERQQQNEENQNNNGDNIVGEVIEVTDSESSIALTESASDDFIFDNGILGFGGMQYLALSLKEVNYPFMTVFSPKNSKTDVNCYSTYQGMVCQDPISNMFAGDAYQVDSSCIHQGVVKIVYKNRPLAFKTNVENLNYYWVLKFRDDSREGVVAKITVKLAQTHPYSFGCETNPSGIFFPQLDSYYCGYNFNGCRMRRVKHYVYSMTLLSSYGISCNEDEEIYPSDRNYLMVDNKTDSKALVFRNIDSIEYPGLPKFRLFRKRSETSGMFSYRCGCIDKNGFETSRLTIYNARSTMVPGVYLFDMTKYLLMIPVVPMFLPKFDRSRLFDDVRSDLNNSIPEVELIHVKNIHNLTKYKIILNEGTVCRLAIIPPIPLYQAQTVNIASTIPQEMGYKYTLEGVRHNDSINKDKRYTDASFSRQRLFPVNLTRYFYKVVRGGSDYLIPQEYSSILATNVEGLRIETKNLVGTDIKNYENLHIKLPVGSIVVIKDDNMSQIELVYASGAISKPKVKMIEDDNTTSSNGDHNKDSSSKSNKETNRKEKKKKNRSRITYEEQPSTSKGINRFLRVNKRNKNKNKKQEEIKTKKAKLEIKGKEEKKELIRDIRKMEILGIYEVVIKATNPWVYGCGVTDGEDYFKPDTEKIIEKDKVVGCRVRIMEKKTAGFYCPEPYVSDPPNCFDSFYETEEKKTIEIKAIEIKGKLLERIEHKNKAFTYIRYINGMLKEYMLLFKKEKVFTCYCRTIYGKEVSRIEIII